MTLGFKTYINGKPTYFVEKIIKSAPLSNYNLVQDYYSRFPSYPKHKGELHAKFHTIREDKTDRWKVGNDIHFVINNRTKNRFQFAPVLKVKSIQKIFIHIDKGLSSDLYRFVKIDNRQLSNKEIEDLAINDGFENIKDFFDWFDKDFEGKIIHWTSCSY